MILETTNPSWAWGVRLRRYSDKHSVHESSGC